MKQMVGKGVDIVEEINLREMINIIWDGRWIILIITAAFVMISGIVSFFVITPNYNASATLNIDSQMTERNPADASPTGRLIHSVYPSMTMDMYMDEVKNPVVMNNVLNQLDTDEVITIDTLESKIDVQVLAEDQVLVISVNDPNPTLAKTIVELVAEEWILYMNQHTAELFKEFSEELEMLWEHAEEEANVARGEFKRFIEQSNRFNELPALIESRIDQLGVYHTDLDQIDINRQTLLAEIEQATEELDRIQGSRRESDSLREEVQNALTFKRIELAGLENQEKEIERKIENNQTLLQDLQFKYLDQKTQHDRIMSEIEHHQGIQDRLVEEKRMAKQFLEETEKEEGHIRLSHSTLGSANSLALSKKLNLLIAGVLGGMISLGVVFFKYYWRHTSSITNNLQS